MIANAWQSMTSSPRIFSQSNEKVGGRFIVVGSGPSLDNDLMPYVSLVLILQ